MQLDYSYIILFGRIIVFEPVTALTNLILAAICLICYKKANLFKTPLAWNWARFFFFIGMSAMFGAFVHAAHFQLGSFFIKASTFLTNALSLLAMYFCFQASNTFYFEEKISNGKRGTWLVIGWILVLLGFTLARNNFLLIKVHAGITLVYALIVHLIKFKDDGSPQIVWGIILSFFSIAVHSLQVSAGKWLNHKDIAHLIIMGSILIIYSGVRKKITRSRAHPDILRSVTAQ